MSSLEPHFESIIDKVLKGEYKEPPATWVDYICLGLCLGATLFFAGLTYKDITGNASIFSIAGDLCLTFGFFVMLCRGVRREEDE